MSQLIKLESFQYELAVAETYEQIKLLDTKAAALAEIARKEKLGKEKQDEIGLFRIEVEQKKGAWLDENFPNGVRTDRKIKLSNRSRATMAELGVKFDESANARLVNRKAEHEPDVIKEVVQEIMDNPQKVVTPNAVVTELRKREKRFACLCQAGIART